MVAVHTVPRDAAHLRRVDVAPFAVPLLVLCIKNTTGVKGITNVDHKLYIPKFLEGLIHFVRNRLLAIPWSDISMCHWIPAPVTQHQEGCNATVRTVRTVRWSWWIAAGIADHQAEETAQPKPGAVDHDAGAANFEQLWAERLAAAAAHTFSHCPKWIKTAQLSAQPTQLVSAPKVWRRTSFFWNILKGLQVCKTDRTSIAGLLLLPPWKSLEETGRACRFLGRIILRVLEKLHSPQTAKKFFQSKGVFRSSTRDSSPGG